MKNRHIFLFTVAIAIIIYTISLIFGLYYVESNPEKFAPSIKPEAYIENRLY